ncbi:MAG: peroxiredoxin [Sphingomicrobium sp.]
MDTKNSQFCLRIGDLAPDFEARSTNGAIRLSDFRGQWLVLFSHPADFTPVCTTEFVALARARDEFDALGCQLMAISVDSLYSHFAWLRAIRDRFDVEVRFPIVEDPTLVIGEAYGMVGADSTDSSSVRTTFFIDPEGRIRATTSYPASVGRSVVEMLRLVAALQASEEKAALAPEGWTPGNPLLRLPRPTLDEIYASEDPIGWFFAEDER